jgi:sulfatase maturation enzyme AslB (radical SAM superfamily)
MLYAGTAMATSSVADRPYHVIVKPIGAVCNLHCQYCYYLEKTALYPDERSFRMPDEVLEELTRQYIESQPEAVQELHFSWQGGEPTLLEIEFFRKAISLQKKYQRPGLRILNTIQTNGTLLDEEWGRFLSDEDFLVGISIDGPEPIHDRFRRDAAGAGSLDSALRGLEVLKKHRVEFNILTVVNRVNGDQPTSTAGSRPMWEKSLSSTSMCSWAFIWGFPPPCACLLRPAAGPWPWSTMVIFTAATTSCSRITCSAISPTSP